MFGGPPGLLPLALALVGALALEARAAAQRPSPAPSDLALRGLGYALIALFWFQFSWRPWLAALSLLLTVAILAQVDRLKRRVIGEPLVFSDLALIPQVPRHPQLYYTLPLSDPRVWGPLLIGLGIVLAFYRFEPSLLPDGLAGLAALLGLPAGLAALPALARTGPGRAWIRARFPRPDLARDVARYGLAATMMGYALRRRDEAAEERAAAAPPPAAVPAAPDDAVVVVVQLESFLDPVRLGGPALPLTARIRAQATQYGRLAVPAHGAYTMRTEHAVLTGLPPDALGFGRYDPFAARRGEEPTSLARLARAAGFATVFVHPFDARFFDRAALYPRLGFDRLVTEEAFADAPRIGPYVGDEAVARRILAEVAGGRPRFVFAVTMENHGPWGEGRLPGLGTPLARYLHHVAGTGRAVEVLIDGLAGRRATLCVFGDHAPSLPEARPEAGRPLATDYALFRFGHPAPAAPVRADLSAAELGCLLRDAFAANRPGLKSQA